MTLNFKFIFFLFFTIIINCNRKVIRLDTDIETELFSIVVQNAIKEESITIFIDPEPFKIPVNQSDTRWEDYVNEPEFLLDERKKIIDEKEIPEGSIKIYSTCPFPNPMVPPLKDDEKQENDSLPEPCEKYLNTGLLKISLSELPDQNGKNINYERRIRAIQLFNNGSMVKDLYLKLVDGKWKITDTQIVSAIFS